MVYMERSERISILKQHEAACYSICYYLLQSEALACDAAKHALCSLMKCDAFFKANARTVSDLLRKESMKSALQIRKEQSGLMPLQ